jgi:signal transduction histidine kinase
MWFEAGLIFSVVVGGWLALEHAMAEAWARRSPAVGWLGGFGALWAGSELMLLGAEGPDEIALCRRMLYLGVYGGTFCWFWTSVAASTPRWYRESPRRLALLAVPSAVLYSTMYWAPDGVLVSLYSEEPGHGPLFYVSAVVSWILICAGLWHYARAAIGLKRVSPVRTAALAAAIVVPLATNVLYAFGTFGTTDPTPALLGATALMIRFGVVEPGLAHYLPLARKDIVEQLAVGVVVADIRGTVIDSNASARRLLGVARPEGESLDDLCLRLEPGVEALRFPLRSRLTETGSAAVLTDRRDAIETERRLQLAGRLQAVGSLTAGMAHEINNPLAFIRSNLNLIEKLVAELVSPGVNARLPDRVRLLAMDGAESLVDAKDGIERIALLVARLKDFARDTSRGPGGAGPVDLAEAALRAAAVAGVGLPAGAIEISTHGDPVVHTDEPLVVQILVNLVLNAVQASSDQPEVTIDVLRSSDTLSVRIADRGEGLASGLEDRVFDPFFTTKDAGSGLGLSISYELARQLGGRIEAANRDGGGATFTLYLPARRPPIG